MNFSATKSNVETEFNEIDSKGAWLQLFQHIKKECLNYDYTCCEASKPENKNFNRYRDVSPYDHSRVVLAKGECNYINANLVTMDRTHRRYILTQGPLPNTAGHFWLMVWEQHCKAVLMLNRVIENDQVKCHQYWPLGAEAGPSGDDVMVFAEVGLRVQYISHTKASYYTTRILRLTEVETNASRDILHYHYTHWPDFGVPQSPTAFLNFLLVVRQSGALDQTAGPPVVHCSAGIGRSGTFCLVDSCLVLIQENGLDSVNVRELLLEMRTYRMGLIQTPHQLRFSYLAIIEGAKRLGNANILKDFDASLMELISQSEMEDIPPDEDEPPPLPPPRGASLTLSGGQLNNHDGHTDSSDSSPDEDEACPPDKPLPFCPAEPPAIPSPEASSPPLPSRPLLTETAAYSSDEGSFKTTSPPSSPDSPRNTNARAGVRQRRLEQKERMTQQVREMKRKQQSAESWQKMKRSLLNPFNIGVGLVLCIGGGALAYSYFTRV